MRPTSRTLDRMCRPFGADAYVMTTSTYHLTQEPLPTIRPVPGRLRAAVTRRVEEHRAMRAYDQFERSVANLDMRARAELRSEYLAQQ